MPVRALGAQATSRAPWASMHANIENPMNLLQPSRERLTVGGLPITCLDRDGFAQLLVEDFRLQRQSGGTLPARKSYSVNGQVLAEVNASIELKELYRRADYLDADGMWVIFASRLFCAHPLPGRVATTDFFHDAARISSEHGISFFILGSTPENNDAACRQIQQQYPRLRIAGRHHGYISMADEDDIVAKINASKADVVWVAMGHPKQELLVDRIAPRLGGVTWIKTCGGLLEHILGLHPRAPAWIQRIGFEWLHRMLLEPKRLGWRYLRTNPLAIWHLVTKSARHREPTAAGRKE